MCRRLSDIPGLVFLLASVAVPCRAQFYPLVGLGQAANPTKFPGAVPRLVLYNPFSGQQLEPLRYSALLRGRRQPVNGNIVELPQLWQPCSCAEFSCRCCLGLALGLGGSANQRLCAALDYNRADLGLRLSVEINQLNVATFAVSARNPPEYCVPMPLSSCLRLYDIRAFDEGNMQVCLSVVLKVLANQFFEYRLSCLRFGARGVFFVRDALQDQGQDQEAQDLVSRSDAGRYEPKKLSDRSSFSFYGR
ncbi:uncharacterized protein LOC6552020 [Drosophila erecta]|uniref:GG11785 n=1 Tax=Drosophila erecta TaxID=7220 RepID=B3P265_DROER|nr:uncharacterized protein LOC6552020 [Drosophila erecta]EDV47743.1 uncharacterized protein Dere_GG11785 [Drosophila erecta]